MALHHRCEHLGICECMRSQLMPQARVWAQPFSRQLTSCQLLATLPGLVSWSRRLVIAITHSIRLHHVFEFGACLNLCLRRV